MERIGAAMMGAAVPDPVIFEAVGVPGMLQSLHRRGPAAQPHRGGGGVHAHRHHRALHGGDQGDGAALLLRLHPRRVRRHAASAWPTACPGPTLLVTSTVDLAGAPGAFETLRTPGEHGKILVTP